MQNSSANSSKNQKIEFLRLSLTLFVIAGVMALLVAFVNNLTAPTIEKLNKEKTDKALAVVLPAADGFEELSFKNLPETVEGAWKAKNGVGYCIKVCPKGYGGKIETIVGIDKDGNVVGTEIVSMSETSGIGTKIQNDSFKKQFVGKNSVAETETISGATRSSKAFRSGVADALAAYKKLSGGGK